MTIRSASMILLAIFTILLPAVSSGQTIPPENILEKATLHRTPDPILIQGKAFPSLTGGALGYYRVYAYHEGRIEPIRFQIDEMTKDGDYIFPCGEENNKDKSNGIMDPQDVLLFMAHDAGDRVPDTFWPKDSSKGMEIVINDPNDQTKAWAYLFLFNSEKDPPPLCPLPDYTRYDRNTETISSNYYRQQYLITSDGRHTNYYKQFCVLPDAGGTGENFIDRFKVRAVVKVFFGKITIRKNEENLASNALNQWIQGPIRVVRRIETYVKGPLGIKLVRVISDIQYYESMATCPIHFNFPFKIEKMATSMGVKLGTDYAPIAKGSTFYSSSNPQGIPITGNMDGTKDHFNPEPDYWRVMTGKWGSFMTRGVLTPKARQQMEIIQGITDDETLLDPPETYPGCIGFTWQDWKVGQLPGGHYTFYLEFYTPPNYKPGDEVTYLNYLDHPLTLKINDKTIENQTRLYGDERKTLGLLEEVPATASQEAVERQVE